MVDEDEAQSPGGEESRFGWYAYTPEWAVKSDRVIDEEDPISSRISLIQYELVGPFFGDDGPLVDDVDLLRTQYGISIELVRDAMAWNDDTVLTWDGPVEEWERQNFEWKQNLLRRLRAEVHPHIAVEAPRENPPLDVPIWRINVDESGERLVLWDEEALETGQGKPLPPVSPKVTREVLGWCAEIPNYEHGTNENSRAMLAWEDRGMMIAHKLQQHFGDDYSVRTSWG